MASAVNFQPPASPHGTSEQQLKQMYSYLYQLSEKLNVALEQVDGRIGEGISSAIASQRPSTVQTNKPSSGIDPSITQQYQELKALIQSTADAVKSEMTIITTELEKNYTAMSGEFGTYKENLSTIMATTAENTTAIYNYNSRLEAAEGSLAAFQEYDVSSLQYIKLGIIGYEDNGKPIVGLLIGEEFTTVTIDGVEYNAGQNTYAAYTSDKVSFFQNETEMAYLSNSTLHITHIEMPKGGKLIHRPWQIDTDNGYTIRWIGGGV